MKNIAVYCTTRCNTGCQHCRYNSVPKGEDMSLDVMRELKKELGRRATKSAEKNEPIEKVEIVFTGGGEPLEWPHLPEAVRMLKDIPRVILILITSGCLNKKDNRFAILKEAMKQADGKIIVHHSFNIFSSTFPERLTFTLPFVLLKGAYQNTFIKMYSGLSGEGDFINLHFREVRESMEKALQQAIGGYSKLISFSPKENNYKPARLSALLKDGSRHRSTLDHWLTRRVFRTSTVYMPYDLCFRNNRIISYGGLTGLRGRVKNFLPPTANNALYAFGLGFACGSMSQTTVDLSTEGNFIFCPEKNFPPFPMGKAGDNLEKALRIKSRLARKVLNLQRHDLTELSFDPCDNCIRKAWDIYNRIGIK